MQLIAKALLAAFWLVIVPGAAGIPYLKKKKGFTLGESFLTGILFLFSVSEAVLLAATFLGLSLNLTSGVIALVMLLGAGFGLFSLKGELKKRAAGVLPALKRMSPWLAAAVLLIGIQIFVAVFYAHFDADDAFYLGTATAAMETNTVFAVEPYTGALYETLPKRYVLSPFPVLAAVFGRLCGGLHPAIVAHVFYPAVFLGAAYLCLYYMAKRWLGEDRHSVGMFMVFAAVLTWFSGFSVYTSGNFGLVRIWQGKAVLAAVLLPLTLYLSMSILLEKEPEYPTALLFMANLACCHVSSMGIMLSPVMLGLVSLLGAWKNKSLKPFLRGMLCCLPSLVLGAVYLML